VGPATGLPTLRQDTRRGPSADQRRASVVVQPLRRRQSAEDRGCYKSEEEEARLRKRGLWVDEAPVPPWEWRRGDRAKF
jgi:endonuclease YncB( thermonuclease family)